MHIHACTLSPSHGITKKKWSDYVVSEAVALYSVVSSTIIIILEVTMKQKTISKTNDQSENCGYLSLWRQKRSIVSYKQSNITRI